MKTGKLTCEKARDISIVSTLENLGHFPKRTMEKEAWFLSPFRSETQASFKVNKMTNRWYDHGMGKGGNIIDLIMELNNFSVRQTLDFLNGSFSSFSFHQPPIYNLQKSYTIKRVKALSNKALLNYIETRKIDRGVAEQYCQELYYILNDKSYFTIAFKNNSEGYEIRNKYYKGSLGTKDISTIGNGASTLMVFEGFIDFLSYKTIYKNHNKNEDFLIMNSVSFVERVEDYAKKYNQVITCLDNDNAGIKATKFLKQNCKNVVDCSFVFSGYKDINDYLLNDFSGVKK